MSGPPSVYAQLLQALDTATTAVLPVLGICPQQLTICTRTWSGDATGTGVGRGTYTDSNLTLIKKLFVRQLVTREIETSGGKYEEGAIEISGIVPNHPANGPSEGYTEAQLAPPITQSGVERIYIVTSSGGGAHGGEYELAELRTADPWDWRLILNRRRTTALVAVPPTTP